MSDWSDHTFVASDGTKLHYVEMGEGDPILLLHGAGGSAVGNWFANGIAPALAKTHRVIGLDQRGHGLSEDGPRSGTGMMAKDVVELLKDFGYEQAHIGGYSMGGAVTLGLLSRHPELFLSAHFGGAGIPETTEFADSIPPDPPGGDPEAKAAQSSYTQVQRERGAEVGNGAGESGSSKIVAALRNMTDEQRAAMAARCSSVMLRRAATIWLAPLSSPARLPTSAPRSFCTAL